MILLCIGIQLSEWIYVRFEFYILYLENQYFMLLIKSFSSNNKIIDKLYDLKRKIDK